MSEDNTCYILDPENGVVKKETKRTLWSKDLDSFIDNLRASSSESIKKLPQDVVEYHKKDRNEVYITYRPPGLVKCGLSLMGFEISNLPILQPARVLIFPIRNGRFYNAAKVGFTKAGSRDEFDSSNYPLNAMWMPNCYGDPGHICAGIHADDILIGNDLTNQQKIKFLMDHVDNSVFNADLYNFIHILNRNEELWTHMQQDIYYNGDYMWPGSHHPESFLDLDPDDFCADLDEDYGFSTVQWIKLLSRYSMVEVGRIGERAAAKEIQRLHNDVCSADLNIASWVNSFLSNDI